MSGAGYPGDGNGWNQWSKHVLNELKRQEILNKELHNKLDGSIKDVNKTLKIIEIDIAVIQTKARMMGAMWGFFAGLLPTVIVAVITHYLK